MSDSSEGARQVFVFGGSNSAMKLGWVNDLREVIGGRYTVFNKSMGGTSSLMGYFRAAGALEMKEGDIAVWAYAINDDNQVSAGAPPELITENMLWFFQECRNRGVHVLPVVMESRHKFRRPNRTPFLSSVVQFLESEKIDYVDGRRLTIGKSPDEIAEQYSDPLHFKVAGWLSKTYAAETARLLDHGFSSKKAQPFRANSLKGKSLHIVYDADAERKEAFGNSLVSGELHSIPCTFNNVPEGVLKAVIVRAAETGGGVTLAGVGSVVPALSLRTIGTKQDNGTRRILPFEVKHLLVEIVAYPKRVTVKRSVMFVRPKKGAFIQKMNAFNPVTHPAMQGDGIIAIIVETGGPKTYRMSLTKRLIRLGNSTLRLERFRRFFGA